MTNKQALREAAEKANPEQYGFYLVDAFTELATPAAVLALLDELEAKDKRIADLEAREVKLPKRSVAEVMLMSGFDRQYAEGWCAGNDNAIHEIHVAGIRINGEG